MRRLRTIAAIGAACVVNLTGAAHAKGQDIGTSAPTVPGRALQAFDSTATVVTESMHRELARVGKAEVDYYVANHRYAGDVADLDLTIGDGTVVTIDSADDRSYHAVATNPDAPGAVVELVALAPPRGIMAARGLRRPAADSAGLGRDGTDSTGAPVDEADQSH
jgi:hypothetical protein